MKRRIALTLFFSLITLSPLWAGNQPDEKQIAAFAEAFERAWTSRNLDEIKQLIALEGVPPASTDKQVGYWGMVMEIAKEKPEEWGGAKFQSLSETLAEKPGRNTAGIRRMVEDRTIHGRRYVQSVPVLGTMSLYIWGKSSVLLPVGVDRDGALKIAVLKPAEGVTPADQIGEPMEPQGFAKADPTETAVARFREYLIQAASTGKWMDLYCTDGAPRDLVDMSLSDSVPLMEQYKGMDCEVSLTPVSAMFSETEGATHTYKKDDYQPQKWDTRWYGLNLPIAGIVRISAKPKEGEKGFSSGMSFPVGMTASGELKKVLHVPVKAPIQSAAE